MDYSAFPKRFWEYHRAGRAWARLGREPKDAVLQLAGSGERHPDPDVANVATRFMRSRLDESRWPFWIQMIWTLLVVAAFDLFDVWTSQATVVIMIVLGGLFLIDHAWERSQASRLANAYRPDASAKEDVSRITPPA